MAGFSQGIQQEKETARVRVLVIGVSLCPLSAAGGRQVLGRTQLPCVFHVFFALLPGAVDAASAVRASDRARGAAVLEPRWRTARVKFLH